MNERINTGIYSFSKHSCKNGIKKRLFKLMTDHEIVTALINNDSSVLDYGCGDCHFFDYLKTKKTNLNMIGYDLDKKYVEIGKKKMYLVVSSLENIKQKFDFIVSNQVVEHMNVIDLSKFFKKSYDLLKMDGKLIISTLNGDEFYSIINIWDDPTHVRPYNKTSLENAASYFNFKIIKIIKHHIRVNPLKILVNMYILG